MVVSLSALNGGNGEAPWRGVWFAFNFLERLVRAFWAMWVFGGEFRKLLGRGLGSRKVEREVWREVELEGPAVVDTWGRAGALLELRSSRTDGSFDFPCPQLLVACMFERSWDLVGLDSDFRIGNQNTLTIRARPSLNFLMQRRDIFRGSCSCKHQAAGSNRPLQHVQD